VAGSGPTDMNGNTPLVDGRNDSFLELAKKLKKKGITTFRYDKRTSGRSKETFENNDMNFNLFVDDCIASIKYLKKLGYKKVIVMGHSQGSLVGMLAGTKEPIDGFISIAGTGYSIDKTLERQLLTQFSENSKEIQTIRSLRENTIDNSFDDNHPLFSFDKQQFLLTWMEHNPFNIISKLDVPILIIQGEADTQTNIDDFNILEKNAKNAQGILISDMNHVLKKVGSDKENIEAYTQPSYSVHENLIEVVNNYINKINNK